MITLRDYQNEMISGVRAKLRTHRNVLLQSPTGSGKTVMAAFMLDRVESKKKRGYFICHRRELVDQTAKTFDALGLPFGYIAAGKPMNLYQPIQICSIDTLKNRTEKVPHPEFTIWDEAHHLGAAGWARVHSVYDQSYHVGLSATPVRLDGRGLDQSFDALVPGPQVSWLIENKFLAEYKLFSVPGVKTEQLHTRMGDFVKSETETEMEKPSIMGDIVSHWMKHAAGRRTIGFAVTVKHSKHLAQSFREAGIPAAHLDADTPDAERRGVLRDLARDKIKVVFNVGLFGEGYDLAANSGIDTTVECVIDASPTKSLGAWLQRCGRALRHQAGYSVILDHGGNALRHGLPCEERHWCLDGRVIMPRNSENDDPLFRVMQCEKCFYVFPSAPECPECGHRPDNSRKVDEVAGDLEEIDPSVFRRKQMADQGRAQTLEDLIETGKNQGKSKPEKWAKHILAARQEKARLQKTLYNLVVGLQHIGEPIELTEREIFLMKPKQLREMISELESKLRAA